MGWTNSVMREERGKGSPAGSGPVLIRNAVSTRCCGQATSTLRDRSPTGLGRNRQQTRRLYAKFCETEETCYRETDIIRFMHQVARVGGTYEAD